jgi:hypothetical protein
MIYNSESGTLNAWWSKYLDTSKWEKGLQGKTLRTYNDAWKVWGPYLSAPVTPQQISDAIIGMRKSGRFTDISVNSYLRTLRAFTHWLADQKLQELVKVHQIRCDKPVPENFSRTRT